MSEFVRRLRERKLLLPPLAGYTDRPFRLVLSAFDPPFICTEMISPFPLIHRVPRFLEALEKVPGRHMSGAQLVGSDPGAMAEAAKVLEQLGYDYVDVNMGCTVKAVTGAGGGVALMRDEAKAAGLASAVASAVDVPVTCKLRLGATGGARNAAGLARCLEDAGVAAVTVHGRTGEKKFGLDVEPGGIRGVVEAVDIPVVANGGVRTGTDARRLINETGAAAVMPGRGLIGNPWLVAEIEAAISGTSYTLPTLDERKEVCLAHLAYLCGFYREKRGVVSMRRILPRYFAGCVNMAALKGENQKAASVGEVRTILDRIVEEVGGPLGSSLDKLKSTHVYHYIRGELIVGHTRP